MNEETRNLLDTTFVDAFGCRFDSDLIDLDDMEDILDLADTVVIDLTLRGVSREDIIRPLTQALARWSPAVIQEFNNATNGSWARNLSTEEALKAIIRRMIAKANSEK